MKRCILLAVVVVSGLVGQASAIDMAGRLRYDGFIGDYPEFETAGGDDCFARSNCRSCMNVWDGYCNERHTWGFHKLGWHKGLFHKSHGCKAGCGDCQTDCGCEQACEEPACDCEPECCPKKHCFRPFAWLKRCCAKLHRGCGCNDCDVCDTCNGGEVSEGSLEPTPAEKDDAPSPPMGVSAQRFPVLPRAWGLFPRS